MSKIRNAATLSSNFNHLYHQFEKPTEPHENEFNNIFISMIFLTKQFPHKPEHTKCIKKTVQVHVMSEGVLSGTMLSTAVVLSQRAARLYAAALQPKTGTTGANQSQPLTPAEVCSSSAVSY